MPPPNHVWTAEAEKELVAVRIAYVAMQDDAEAAFKRWCAKGSDPANWESLMAMIEGFHDLAENLRQRAQIFDAVSARAQVCLDRAMHEHPEFLPAMDEGAKRRLEANAD
ncbi:hypothetical protein ACI6QG_04050 [Roseococcus sp. DSY-14]|uniref:hypothetical protein n=1 Tax=Roseococcus sp. DSY-14 TaxID=3369650 RepID=UPI00387B4032